MRRIVIFTLLALTMLGGVAAAEHPHRHRVRDHRGGVYVQRVPRHHHDGSRYVVRPSYRSSYRVVRRPIYVQRPVIAYRYYNYYRRPAVIVENYPPITGYTWIAGHWDWNGYEWIWNPGHYEPDQTYDQYPYQYQDAPSGYYDPYNNSGYSY